MAAGETFNGKLRDELLNRELFLSLPEARYVLDEWREEYNQRGPHSGPTAIQAWGSGPPPLAPSPIDHSGSPRCMSVFGTPVAHDLRRLRMTAGPLGRAALGPGGLGKHTLFRLGAGPSSSCPRFPRCPCEHPPASMRPTGSVPSADPTRDRRAARARPMSGYCLPAG